MAAVLMVVPTDAAALSGSGKRCERVIGRGLGRCFHQVSRALNRCHADTGAPCAAAELSRALDALQRRVVAGCSQAAVAELGYGPQLTAPALAARVQEACRGEAEALAARTFGGPHGAVLATATAEGAACLETAAARAERLRVLFGGVSAGGFGVAYNYHYVLDDLRWTGTTAVPDSALGLNNGSIVGVAGLGILMVGTVTGWGGLPFQPPYCLPSICAVVPYRNVQTSPRLKRTPLQQILTVSNQVDSTQRSTTRFSSAAAWTNAARQAYCETRNRPGLRCFLPANPASIHGMVGSNPRFTTTTSDGVTLRDWLAGAMTDPDTVIDLVEEGTLTTSNPAISPFPCQVG